MERAPVSYDGCTEPETVDYRIIGVHSHVSGQYGPRARRGERQPLCARCVDLRRTPALLWVIVHARIATLFREHHAGMHLHAAVMHVDFELYFSLCAPHPSVACVMMHESTRERVRAHRSTWRL